MPPNKNKSKTSQQGNVFLIILVGVILFGALGFTFSRSANKGTGNLTKQQAKVAAQEILNYARLVEGAVDRVRRNGCSESEISFENNVASPGYTNTNSPIDKSCHIFEPEGGKIEYTLINETSLWDANSGSVLWQKPEYRVGHQILEVGSTSDELLLVIFFIESSVCIEINNLLNVDNPSNIPPVDDTPVSSSKFTGTFPGALDTLGDESGNILEGQQSFCRTTAANVLAGNPVGQFIHTLLAR